MKNTLSENYFLLNRNALFILSPDKKKKLSFLYSYLRVSTYFPALFLSITGYKVFYNQESTFFFIQAILDFVIFCIISCLAIYNEKKTPIFKNKLAFASVFLSSLLVFLIGYLSCFITTKYDDKKNFINLNFFLWAFIMLNTLVAFALTFYYTIINHLTPKYKSILSLKG